MTEQAKEAVKVEGKMAEFIEYIQGITVLELSQLVKALEEKLGVSAAMPMAAAAAPAAAAAASLPSLPGCRALLRRGSRR